MIICGNCFGTDGNHQFNCPNRVRELEAEIERLKSIIKELYEK